MLAGRKAAIVPCDTMQNHPSSYTLLVFLLVSQKNKEIFYLKISVLVV